MENKINTNLKFGIFSKTLITVLILFYTATFLNKNFNLIYANIPLFSLLKFEVYRIIPGCFISDNIIELIFNIVIVMTIINYYENKEGTIKTFIKNFSKAIFLLTFSFLSEKYLGFSVK